MSDVFGGGEAAIESASGSEKPLTDQERALLQRLLSDPFSIPQQFKTWMVAYLEGSDMLLSRSSVQGLSTLLGSGGGEGVFGLLPAGLIFPFGGAAAPVGAELCDGTSYAIEGKYKRLFDAIGYLYGGSGANFNVPDLRRRIPFGAGTGIGQGASDGQAEDSRHIDHHHNFGQTSSPGGGHSHGGSVGGVGDHRHPAQGANFAEQGGTQTGASGSARYTTQNPQFDTGWAGAHGHSLSIDGVGDHDHFVAGDTTGGFEQDRPSFLTVGFIINY
jgi:Phage Tail Collar Domain